MSDAPFDQPATNPNLGGSGSAPESAPPGWYPHPATGQQAWWDGTQWVAAAAPVPVASADTSAERTMAMLAHLSGLVAPFLGPLILMLVSRPEQRFAKYHAVEALNFAITVVIAGIVSVLLMFVLIGFLLAPVVGVGALVFNIVAGVAANRGEWYRYPLCLRLIPNEV